MASHWFRGEFMQLLGCSQTLEAAHNHSNVAGRDRVKEETGSLPTPTHPPLHNLSLPPTPNPHPHQSVQSPTFTLVKGPGFTYLRTRLERGGSYLRSENDRNRSAELMQSQGAKKGRERQKREIERERGRESLQATQKQAPVFAWS